VRGGQHVARAAQTPAASENNHPPSAAGRLLRAIVLILLGMAVTAGSAASDAYLHRGAMDGSSIVFRQPVGQALATNVELRGLTDNAMRSELAILKDAGYQFVRQSVSWSDVESVPGTYDWSLYLPIITTITEYGLTPVLILRDSPIWARAPADVDAIDAPPLLGDWFQAYCASLRATFPDLRFFQIGANLDDPNYWGNQPVTSFKYAQMLRAASVGLAIAANDSVLISGDLGSSAEARASGADLETIRRLMVNPDIRGLLRVLAITVDGGVRSPYDRSVSQGTDNLSRAILVRETLDDIGATDFPVWITRLGWTGNGQTITADHQAEFVTTGLRRIRNEWPWVGLVFNWDYGNSTDLPPNANLALVVNGQTTPLLLAMTNYGRSVLGTSITNGFVPPTVQACAYSGEWQDQHLAEGIYRITTDSAAQVTCSFWGTGFSTFFRFSPDGGTVRYVIDQPTLPPVGEGTDVGNVYLTWSVTDAFESPVQLAAGLEEGQHTVTIGLADTGEVVIGGFLVQRERPMIWPIAVLVAAGLVALFLGLRIIAYLAAEMVGLVDTRPAHPSQTSLPVLANWNPGPRKRR